MGPKERDIPHLPKPTDEKSPSMFPAAKLSCLPKKKQKFFRISADAAVHAVPVPGGPAESASANRQTGRCGTYQNHIRAEGQPAFRANKFAAYFPEGPTAEQMEESILRMLAERRRKLQKARDDVAR